MAPTSRNPDVDWYFDKPSRWQEAFAGLRAIALGCGLGEELKWGHPCYTDAGKNVVLIHGFKDYCALLFLKGALLDDPEGILVQQTANVQSARQVRFTSAGEVADRADFLAAYLRQAIEVERSGRQVDRRATGDLDVPEELSRALDDVPGLREAFAALTPGRQRAYLLHFSSAKRSETRAARIEKCVERILAGKGLDDR